MSITVKGASSELIYSLAKDYTQNSWITFENLGWSYDITAKMVSAILYRGIAEDILSNNVAEKIYKKVVYASDKGITQRMTRWEKAFDERENLRYNKKLKKKLSDEIQLVELQISTFDESSSDEGPSIEELQNKLFNLNLKLSKI